MSKKYVRISKILTLEHRLQWNINKRCAGTLKLEHRPKCAGTPRFKELRWNNDNRCSSVICRCSSALIVVPEFNPWWNGLVIPYCSVKHYNGVPVSGFTTSHGKTSYLRYFTILAIFFSQVH